MPTTAVDGKPLTESKQRLDAWQESLGRNSTCADMPGAAYAPVTAEDNDGGRIGGMNESAARQQGAGL